MLSNSHLGAVSDGKKTEGLAFLGVVAERQLKDGVWSCLDSFGQVRTTALTISVLNYSTLHHTMPSSLTPCVRSPLSCGTERTTPACCTCLTTWSAKCGSRLSNSYSRPTKPSWRPTATIATARYPPPALLLWGLVATSHLL